MKRCGKLVVGMVAIGGFWLSLSPVLAQTTTFRNYHCADGSEFILGFYPYDSSAYLQIDGNPVTLRKRVALSGERYSGSGVTLRFLKSGGISVKHAGRKVTTCELM